MTTQTNPDWTRDELIVALDVYLRHRPNPPGKDSKEISELSKRLVALGDRLFPPESRTATFRNNNGVYMKLMNFRRLDPQYTSGGRKGLARGAKGEEDVWAEFATDPTRCCLVASAIVAGLKDPAIAAGSLMNTFDDDVEEAQEGRLLTRVHIVRERDRRLVTAKINRVLKEHGELRCVACDFDFEARYGERGTRFIECHHTKPVAHLEDGARTRLEDLELVCSNCHRMIHRKRPWLSIEQLKTILISTPSE